MNRFMVRLPAEQYSSFKHKAVSRIYEAIVSLDMDLQQTLLLFDVNGDGTVELQELRHVLGLFDLGLTDAQITRLAGRLMTLVEDGAETPRIKVDDFLKQFSVVYRQAEVNEHS